MRGLRAILPPPIFWLATCLCLYVWWPEKTPIQEAINETLSAHLRDGVSEPLVESSFPEFSETLTTSYSEELLKVASRPLFFDGRKPIETKSGTNDGSKNLPKPRVVSAPPPTLEYLGFLRLDGGLRGLLRVSGVDQWVVAGDEIQGWFIQAVTISGITISKDGAEHVVALEF